METTKNCSLKKPGQNDFYDVQDFDDNMETIDEHIGALESPVYEESKELEELKSGEPYLSAFGKIKKAVGALIAHIGDKDNPHGVTLAQLGAAAANTLANHIQNKSNPHGVTKAQVGLGNCDNTADDVKSVKYAKTAGSAVDQTARNAASSANTNANNRLAKSGDTMNGVLNMNGHNIMYPSRIQGPDGKPIVVASGDGNNNNTYVDLLGSRVQCRNTNGTAWIPVQGYSFTNPSSRLIKENIRDMSEEEAKKILDVRIVDFDYKEAFGGQKGQEGVIAEELLELFPHAVTVPDEYDETNFDESKGLENQIMSVDYAKLVSPLIKLVQMQQSQIDILQTRVSALEKGALK